MAVTLSWHAGNPVDRPYLNPIEIPLAIMFDWSNRISFVFSLSIIFNQRKFFLPRPSWRVVCLELCLLCVEWIWLKCCVRGSDRSDQLLPQYVRSENDGTTARRCQSAYFTHLGWWGPFPQCFHGSSIGQVNIQLSIWFTVYLIASVWFLNGLTRVILWIVNLSLFFLMVVGLTCRVLSIELATPSSVSISSSYPPFSRPQWLLASFLFFGFWLSWFAQHVGLFGLACRPLRMTVDIKNENVFLFQTMTDGWRTSP